MRARVAAAALLAAISLQVQADDDSFEVITLSNRADLISGGDALVEVRVPKGVALSRVSVTRNGADVTALFSPAGPSALRGLVTGLVEGRNEVAARIDGRGRGDGRRERLEITNHPIGGPGLSGPQITPFFCATPVPLGASSTSPTTNASGLSTAAIDAQCNIATEFKLYYRTTLPCSNVLPDPSPNTSNFLNPTPPTSVTPPANACFKPYNPASPPPAAEVAMTTTDAGVTVPFIVRVERGTMNRGIYDIAVLVDHWNGKVLYQFGASTGQPRRQSRSSSNWTSGEAALSRGYLVAQNSMTDSALNSNRVSMAETVMMMKEHIGERYGEIRFTMGTGCSGGSINSNLNASIMPGNLDGITISCAYPDSETTGIEVGDCTLLAEAYNKPQWLALQGGLTQAQINAKKAAIHGHPDQTGCQGWYNAFGSNGKVGNYTQRFVLDFNSGFIGTFPVPNDPRALPTNNCQLPYAMVYDAATNPTGARCHAWNWAASIFGTTPNDLSADPTDSRALDTRDNAGVQYGLKAMLSGAISPEEFVTLNEIVGGTDKDSNFSATRTVADRRALEIAYRAGLVMSGRQYAKTAVIDLRGWDDAGSGIPIHYQWRSFSIRDRRDREYGDHGNQVIWWFTTGLLPSAALSAEAFLTMDQWLTNLKADTSNRRIEDKVRATKPSNAVDFCVVAGGTRVFDLSACEAADLAGGATAPSRFRVGSSPRQVAGGPLSENILKCRLKPLNSADYAPIVLSSSQLARLQAVFPDGVCDWDERGVEQERARAPRDYTDGPGGEHLRREPDSH